MGKGGISFSTLYFPPLHEENVQPAPNHRYKPTTATTTTKMFAIFFMLEGKKARGKIDEEKRENKVPNKKRKECKSTVNLSKKIRTRMEKSVTLCVDEEAAQFSID